MAKRTIDDGEPKGKKPGGLSRHREMMMKENHGHSPVATDSRHGHKPMHRSMKKPRGA